MGVFISVPQLLLGFSVDFWLGDSMFLGSVFSRFVWGI